MVQNDLLDLKHESKTENKITIESHKLNGCAAPDDSDAAGQNQTSTIPIHSSDEIPKISPDLNSKTHYRVGYWLNVKSTQLKSWTESIELCRRHGIELVELDLDSELEIQLPFDLIVHKIIALYKPKLRGANSTVGAHFKRLLSFIENHPEIRVIDPVDPQFELFNREYVCKLIQNTCDELKIDWKNINGSLETGENPEYNVCVEIPTWHKLDKAPESEVELEKLTGLQLPCICKCVDTWDAKSHEMSIIFSWNQLLDSSQVPRYPIILQNFVRHQMVLFKVYVFGEEIVIQKRPSVDIPENYNSETGPIIFNGHKLSKTDQTDLTDVQIQQLQCPNVHACFHMQTVSRVVESIRKKIGLNIFGLDFLIAANEQISTSACDTSDANNESSVNPHYLVDINPFPGWSSLNHLPDLLLKFLLSKLETH